MSTAPDAATAALKDALAEVWGTGDYGRIAEPLAAGSEAFFASLPIAPGDRLLDIACGTGQITLPAARAGARATGLDLVEDWLEQARARAAAEGLDIAFDRGDAEALPYADSSFDVVVSLIGAMFAPRPERVTAEMLRVCRPGGRIFMGNWTAEGFVGGFFATLAAHVPPPEMPSPLLWGEEATVRARLGPDVSDLTMARRMLRFDYAAGPEETTAHYARHFGPVAASFAALDPDGQAALAADLVALFERWGRPTEGGGMTVEAEILEIRARRA